MPREYKSTAGPGYQNPLGFSQSDLNVSTPRFVAQIAVAPTENPFEALQKILGLTVDIAGRATSMASQEIEGKISYQRALEARQEQTRIETKRTEAEAAASWEATRRLKLQQATSEEAVKAIREEATKDIPGASTQMIESQAQVAVAASSVSNQLRIAADREILDATKAMVATMSDSIGSAYIANDIDGLDGIVKTLSDRLKSEKDPDKISELNKLRNEAFARVSSLREKADTNLKTEERAAAILAKDMTDKAVTPIVNGLFADIPAFMAGIKSVSDESLTAAVFDYVRDSMLEKNPNMASVLISGSDEEQSAVSSAILDKIQPLIARAAEIRTRQNQFKSNEILVNSLAHDAYVNGFDSAFAKATTDPELASSTLKSKAIQEVIRNAIDRHGSDDIARINEAKRAIDTTQDRDVTIVANREIRAATTRIEQEFVLNRQTILEESSRLGPVFNVDDEAVGWAKLYPNQESFVNFVLSKVGTTLENFRTDPSIQEVFGPMVSRLVAQYDRDYEKTKNNIEASDIRFKREDAASRRLMTVEQGFKHSDAAAAIKDGSYKKMNVEQLESLFADGLQGYSNTGTPKELTDIVIDGYASAENFNAVKAYWNIMSQSNDPTVRISVATNPKYFKSWAVGSYLRYLDKDMEIHGETAVGMTSDFIANLEAYEKPSDSSPEATTRRNIMGDAIEQLSSGAGIDTGYFDITGVSASDVVEKYMAPYDRAMMIDVAVVAAAAPENVDKSAFFVSIMRYNGYRVFYLPREDGSPSFRLIHNVPGQSGAVPLPDPSEVSSGKFRQYLESKKTAIAEYLSSAPTTDVKRTYNASEITKIDINPLDQDMIKGRCAVKAYVAGRWIRIPTESNVFVTQNDYLEWLPNYKKPGLGRWGPPVR